MDPLDEEEDFEFDAFVRRPPSNALEPHIVAKACAEALKRNFSKTGITALMERIPAAVRASQPIKTLLDPIRTSIDTLTVLAPSVFQRFDGNCEDRFLGGSEEAVLCLCRAIARLGRRVVVYTRLPVFTVSGTTFDGVEYRDVTTFHLDGEHGTLVVWRSPVEFLDAFVSDEQRPGISGLHLWTHDEVGYYDRISNFTNFVRCCDTVSSLSNFHRRSLARLFSENHTTYVTIPNGIVSDRLPDLTTVERDPFRVAYTSSPDRGLSTLLITWSEVRRLVSNAELDICYDWTQFDELHPEESARMRRLMSDLDGVRFHGGVSHNELHTIMARTNVWAYSHFLRTHLETFCTSAIKALAMGCTVLTVPVGALPEVVGSNGRFVFSELVFVEALVHALKNPEPESVRFERAASIREAHDWSRVATVANSVWSSHDRERT